MIEAAAAVSVAANLQELGIVRPGLRFEEGGRCRNRTRLEGGGGDKGGMWVGSCSDCMRRGAKWLRWIDFEVIWTFLQGATWILNPSGYCAL